ncbi:MAG: cupredoxin family protein [Thiobacillus sp.]
MKSALLLTALLATPLLAGAPLAHAHAEKKHAPAPNAVAEQTAWGIAGNPAQAKRTLTLDMTDAMRFTPDAITVQEGETVRFVVRNTGRMLHEMVIGTPDELVKHAAMMARFPNMEHDEAYMVHVDPGKTGEIVWTFNRAGRFEFACLIAGHYEAGMRGTVTVTPKQGTAK